MPGDNTTGKERKDLARWIFVAMSAHPEMRGLSSVTEADVERSSKSTAAIFTKLLSETCAAEAREASAKEGSQSLQIAFGMLGELAMQEIASDRNVATVMSNFERYVDQAKVQAAIGVK